MMPLAQVIWIGASASLFVIWAFMLCGVRTVMAQQKSGRLGIARLGGLTATLLALIALGLILWPP